VPAGDKLVVEYEAASAYTTLLVRPSAALVFRDKKGKIIGGAPRYPLDVYARFPPGKSRHTMRVEYGPPSGTDVSSIEFYPYPN